MKEIGAAGQARLAGSLAVVAGLGALGTSVADLLARAGVGTLRLVDRDFVEWSNLQRQRLYDEEDAARALPKAHAACAHLSRINSEIHYEPMIDDINANTVERIVGGASVVVDGLDGFHGRALINEACVKQGIAWVYGAALATCGSSATVVPGVTACLSCIMPEETLDTTMPLTCDTVGVLGPITSLIAAWQASEALKIMVGAVSEVCPDLTHFELWDNEIARVVTVRDTRCEVCARRRFARLERRDRMTTTSVCGREAVQVVPAPSFKLDFDLLRDTLRRSIPVEENAYLVRCRVDGHDLVVFRDGRAMIFGTNDPQRALRLYGKYVGS